MILTSCLHILNVDSGTEATLSEGLGTGGFSLYPLPSTHAQLPLLNTAWKSPICAFTICLLDKGGTGCLVTGF